MQTITISQENFQELIQKAVRDEIYNITHNLSSEEFEDFLRAKRYDTMIEKFEKSKKKLNTQTPKDFLNELKQL